MEPDYLRKWADRWSRYGASVLFRLLRQSYDGRGGSNFDEVNCQIQSDQPQAAWYVAKDPCSLLSKTIRLSKAVAYFS